MEYSDIYDETFANLRKKKFKAHKTTLMKVKEAKSIEHIWNRHSKKILTEIAKVTGLKWKRMEIIGYVSEHSPYDFSNPLTIHARKNDKHQIITITHELIHTILDDNSTRVKWPWSKNSRIYNKYRRESYNTKLHIPIEAIMKLTFENVFGENAEKYLKWERWWERTKVKRSKPYKRAWEIMLKEGPENVLNDIIK